MESVFLFRISYIWTENGISPYSVEMRENMDQNSSECAHILRSGSKHKEIVKRVNCMSES